MIGTAWYSETSSICLAARHDGLIGSTGGNLLLTVERLDYLKEIKAGTLIIINIF
jgi:hypothetical protein